MSIILAISAGTMQSTHSLNVKAIELTKKTNPSVLFIPTATHDEEGYISHMKEYYEKLGCSYDSLKVSSQTPSYEEILEKFKKADLIYVGGGDTEYLIQTWKKTGVDKAIMEVFGEDKVFTGISAGAAYWFHSDFADTDIMKDPEHGDYRFVPCLDLLPFTFNPHYDEPGREKFDWRIREQNYSGIAMDTNTALIIDGGRAKVIKSDENAHVYFIDAWQNFSKREINSLEWI